ncbi:MAG: hypothetical protein ABW061_01550, partial [Polyangiaceae bacterium]
MNLMIQIAGMVIGFVTVMLAASLVVSVMVRVVHYLGNKRGKTLGEMLGGLNQAFRSDNGDLPQPGDAAQTAFVLDVLTYPTLHLSYDRGATAGRAARYLDVQANRQALATRVEYLTEENLLQIVTRLSEADSKVPTSVDVEIPARWYGRLEPDRRTLGEFKAFISAWYKTVERVGTENFAVASRQLTAVLSCVVVVFLCLDGFQLGIDLFRASSQVKDHLAEQGIALLQSPTQADAIHPAALPTADRDALLKDIDSSLTQTNSVLNEPALNLGWQNSWLVKELIRYRRHQPG